MFVMILCPHLTGKIPLRQLVYRVLDLPPSMRPLVYDFGQLQQRTEDDYIKQIVHDHVREREGKDEIFRSILKYMSNLYRSPTMLVSHKSPLTTLMPLLKCWLGHNLT